MVSIANQLYANEIQWRAEQIRTRWSPAERRRRTGLPPDVPRRLRAFILGRREPQWCVARPESFNGDANA